MMYLYITCIHMLHAHAQTQTPLTDALSLYHNWAGFDIEHRPGDQFKPGMIQVRRTYLHIHHMSSTPTEKPVASTKEPCISQQYMLHVQNKCHTPKRARRICKRALQIQNESHNCTRAQCLHKKKKVATHMYTRDLDMCHTGPRPAHLRHGPYQQSFPAFLQVNWVTSISRLNL